VTEAAPALIAHVDETTPVLPDGTLLYGIAAVLTAVSDQSAITAELRGLLLPHQSYLHYYEETPARRVAIAKAIAAMPMTGAIVVTKMAASAAGQLQERVRVRLLSDLLPRLEHTERVSRVVIESRSGADKHDRRTRDRLRRSQHLTGGLHVDHLTKRADCRLWLADFVAGAYIGAELHAEPEPWEVVGAAHMIEVITLP
jgi:hypothetical protein